MRCYTAKYKEWLEKEGEKEGMEIKVRFIKNDYNAWADPNPAWFIKISRCIGTIKIPEDLFLSKKPKFTEKERRAIGIHELGHLKMWKDLGFVRGLRRKITVGQKMIESETDAYVKRHGFGKSFASGLKKFKELREKWGRKSSKWRIKIWWRKHGSTHPDIDKRIEKLVDC
jgi:hypothetical protein